MKKCYHCTMFGVDAKKMYIMYLFIIYQYGGFIFYKCVHVEESILILAYCSMLDKKTSYLNERILPSPNFDNLLPGLFPENFFFNEYNNFNLHRIQGC